MSRVYVSRGELVQTCTTEDGVDYNMAFPLACVDGSPAIGDYRGEGAIVDRAGEKVLVLALGCAVYSYTIGEATKETHDAADGFIFAMRQKRQAAPRGKKSDAFLDGWRMAWMERAA